MKEHIVVASMKWAGTINIVPNTTLPGTQELQSIVGGFMFWTEVILVGSLIAAALSWAVGSHTTNHQLMIRGRSALFIVLAAALVVASANALINWALGVNLGIA